MNKLSEEEIDKLARKSGDIEYLEKLARENIICKVDERNICFRNRMKPQSFGLTKSPLVFEDKSGKLQKCFVTRLNICRNAEPSHMFHEINDIDLKEEILAELNKELQKFDAVISIVEQRRGIGDNYVFNFVDYYCKGVLKESGK